MRKFFFFLDIRRTGRIAINDMVASRVAAEWLQLAPRLRFTPTHPDAAPPPPPPPVIAGAPEGGATGSAMGSPVSWGVGSGSSSVSGASGGGGSVADASAPSSPAAASTVISMDPEEELVVAAFLESIDGPPPGPNNWFSAGNALRVYSQYLELDTDQNGMLSPSELLQFRGGTLTESFVHRVFQECHTYSGEMDYKAFLDFVLGVEYRVSHQSLRYLFRVLDLQRAGQLGRFELRFYLRDIAARMAAAGHDEINVENVCDEIFDMVAPAGGDYITLEDLKRCRCGHTVLFILTDLGGFWSYDNRELLYSQGAEEHVVMADLPPTD